MHAPRLYYVIPLLLQHAACMHNGHVALHRGSTMLHACTTVMFRHTSAVPCLKHVPKLLYVSWFKDISGCGLSAICYREGSAAGMCMIHVNHGGGTGVDAGVLCLDQGLCGLCGLRPLAL
jgi:hypothetical protein